MVRRALVITRTPVFREQVVQALELGGRFRARAFDEFNAALADGQKEPFDLVVLDADAADQPLEQAARTLRRVCPVSALILVPPGNWVSSALVNRIAPDGMLTKPLSLADLTDLLDEIQQRFFGEEAPMHDAQALATPQPEDHIPAETPDNDQPPAGQPEKNSQSTENGRGLVVIRRGAGKDAVQSSHGWLYDVSRAAQYLARLSMETAAHAALIVRGGKIWAYAGELSQENAQELTDLVVSYWHRSDHAPAMARSGAVQMNTQQPDRRDLVRFVRLADEQEFILYATGLVDNLVLALAFDASIPFRMIRTQAVHLAQALAQPPESNVVLPIGEREPVVKVSEARQPQALPGTPLQNHVNEAAGGPPADEPSSPLNKPSLLENVPPPNPVRRSRSQNDSDPPRENASTGFERPPAASNPPVRPGETLPPARAGLKRIEIPAGLPISPVILHTGKPDLDNQDDSAALPPPLQGVPSRTGEQMPNSLEPVTPALSGLLYTCVMVPRLPTHALTGDLAARLAEWMPLLCLAYGWRLEKLEHHKDYLAWVVRVQLDTSPSYLMRILRQKTSLRIFADFPALARENPSGDFWAPGYLILSSGALPSTDTIRAFIQQTRFYQGGTGPITLNTSR